MQSSLLPCIPTLTDSPITQHLRHLPVRIQHRHAHVENHIRRSSVLRAHTNRPAVNSNQITCLTPPLLLMDQRECGIRICYESPAGPIRECRMNTYIVHMCTRMRSIQSLECSYDADCGFIFIRLIGFPHLIFVHSRQIRKIQSVFRVPLFQRLSFFLCSNPLKHTQ